MRLAELHNDSGSSPPSTVRARLKGMTGDGLIVKRARKNSVGVVDYALTDAGTSLLFVVAALERWLLIAPEGPFEFGSAQAKSAIKALEGGWSSTMIGALSMGPQSLGDLAHSIGGVGYPALERRLMAMRRSGQVRTSPSEDHSTPYEVTEWMQQSTAVLAAAVRWERTNFPEATAPMTRLDTEAAFLLTLPLLRMAVGLTGSCRLGVEINDDEGRLCGAVTHVEQGRVMSSLAGIDGPAECWVSGLPPAWARAMVDEGVGDLEIGGGKPLALGLLSGLQGVLFGGRDAVIPDA